MNLQRGFEIEDPAVFVEWGMREADLHALLPAAREIAPGYRTLEVTSLRGLQHTMGFRSSPREGGLLVELELFRRATTLESSFKEFQEHLVATFGPPTVSVEGDNRFPRHRWDIAGTEILHEVADRFGPEEHVRIRRF